MSGVKETTVSVSQREFNRLRQQEARLRTVENDLPERLAAIRQEAATALSRHAEQAQNRWQEMQRTTAALGENLAQLETNTQRRLKEGLERTRRDYVALVNRESRAREDQARQMRDEYSQL